jgi:hypothetical protein
VRKETALTTGDLVPKPLGRDHSDLIDQPLVGVEVEGETRVVSLDEDARGPLDGLGADSTLETERRRWLDWVVCVCD